MYPDDNSRGQFIAAAAAPRHAMGRAFNQLQHFPVWTVLFLIHSTTEFILGASKLRGYFTFEKRDVLQDLQDLRNKKNKRYVENRIRLMQYTRYHALSRITLALIGLFAVAFDGVDGETAVCIDCTYIADMHNMHRHGIEMPLTD